MDHWPALPSPSSAAPSGGQLGTEDSSSKGVDWSVGGKDNEQGQQEGEGEGGEGGGDLQHLMQSLDIAEHLHVLQVCQHTHTHIHTHTHTHTHMYNVPFSWKLHFPLFSVIPPTGMYAFPNNHKQVLHQLHTGLSK